MLRDESLLVLTRKSRIEEKLLKTNSLAKLCPMSCNLHEALNSAKGVIYAPCLKHPSKSEIVQVMKDQGVSDI